MMRELLPKELILLCRGALGLWHARLERILEHTDPSDAPLRELLAERISQEAEATRLFRKLDWRLSLTAPSPCDVAKVDSILKESFPSTALPLGEGALNRDSALYHVEIMEEERSRFFRLAVEADGANGSTRDFTREHERSLRRIETLHSVILPRSGSTSPGPVKVVDEDD